MSIPISNIVTVTPGVLDAAGSAVDLNGLILTKNPAAPYCSIIQFSSVADVKDYFGATSAEGDMAAVYFAGYASAYARPARLYFTRYTEGEPTAASLRGGPVTLSLDEIRKLNGNLVMTIDGVPTDSGVLKLDNVQSLSEVAAIISEGLGAPVTYDGGARAFIVSAPTSGSGSSVSFATGPLAEPFALTKATGAIISLGSDGDTPSDFMDSVTALSQNWALFTTAWACTQGELRGFAQWVSTTNYRFAFVAHDLSEIPMQPVGEYRAYTAPVTFAGLPEDDSHLYKDAVGFGDTSGVIPLYGSHLHAAFVLSYAASLDFTRTNGRTTLAFRNQAGLKASVTNQSQADILEDNGYNFYGEYATAKEDFLFIYPGQITGPFRWVDSYVNQIWLNAQLQLACTTLLRNYPAIPYNAGGYGLIEAALIDPAEQALNFGAIRQGVTLSSAQAAQIREVIGRDITASLTAKGYAIVIKDAPASVRVERESPDITFYYMDGGAVQRIQIASIVVM